MTKLQASPGSSDSKRVGAPDDTEQCFCGHVADEHGGDPNYPGSTACQIEGCDCIAFEKQEGEE